MNKPLKVGLGVVSALLLAVVAVVTMTLSVDPTMFKNQLATLVKETTALDVSFNGPIKVTYFPSLGVQLNQVTVKSSAQAGDGVLATIGLADVSIKVWPLISGRIETGKVVLDGLELNLVRDQQGRFNLPAFPAKEVKIEGEKVVVITEDNQRHVIEYQIEAVRLTNARFSFDDRMANNAYTLTDFNLSTGAVVKGRPFGVKLGFAYTVGNPQATGRVDLDGQATAIPEALRFAFENATFKTTLAASGLPVKTAEAQYTGTIRVDGERKVFEGQGLKFTAKGAGGVLPEAGAGFTLGMDAKADMQAGAADVTGFSFDVMGFTLGGEVHATHLNENQAIMATMTMASNAFHPQQVLKHFGVAVPDDAPAKIKFTAGLDQGKDTLDLTGLAVSALGLDLTGEVHAVGLSGQPSVKGRLALAECNPRQLAVRLGQPLPASADPAALTKLQLAAAFEAVGDTLGLRTESFKLDGAELSLDAKVDKSARPRVAFALKAASLDVDRYMPLASGAKPAASQKEAAKPAEPSQGLPADLNGSVDIAKLKVAKLHLQNVSLKLAVKDNQLEVSPAQVSLYQGTVKASLRADLGGGPNAPLSLTVNADGIQVEPLLTDLEGKSKLSGRASLNAALSAKGQEARRVLSTLAGKASFAVRNGAILGFDLSPEVFSSPEKLMGQGKGQARTNFDQVSASFVLAGGVAATTDLLASVPPHKVTGQGFINLGAETLDMKVLATFAKLAPIPVRLTGPLASPHVSVDAAALATGVAKGVLDTVVKSPQDVLKNPAGAGKGALDAVGNILGLPKK